MASPQLPLRITLHVNSRVSVYSQPAIKHGYANILPVYVDYVTDILVVGHFLPYLASLPAVLAYLLPFQCSERLYLGDCFELRATLWRLGRQLPMEKLTAAHSFNAEWFVSRHWARDLLEYDLLDCCRMAVLWFNHALFLEQHRHEMTVLRANGSNFIVEFDYFGFALLFQLKLNEKYAFLVRVSVIFSVHDIDCVVDL